MWAALVLRVRGTFLRKSAFCCCIGFAQEIEFETINGAEERQANQLSLHTDAMQCNACARLKCTFNVRNDRENCKHSTICVTGLHFIMLIIRYTSMHACTHNNTQCCTHTHIHTNTYRSGKLNMERNYHRTGTHNHIIININRLSKR